MPVRMLPESTLAGRHKRMDELDVLFSQPDLKPSQWAGNERNRQKPEYAEKDIPIGRAMERQLIAEAEREAARRWLDERNEDRRRVEEWAAWRARITLGG